MQSCDVSGGGFEQGCDVGRTTLAPLKRKRLLRTHVLGAMVRTGACALIWVLCLAALFKGAVGPGSFVGASASLLFVVLMNVPMLLVLRFTSSKGWFEFFSFCVNVLETFGYTAFIYFVGGFRSTYLTPIYAAMIFYVGVMAPMRYPLVLAGVSSGMFSVMVYLEHFGYLPHQNVFIRYAYTWDMIVFVLFILTAVLFLIACMAAYTSVVLNEAKKNLKKKNLALEKVNAMLSEEIHERIKAEALLRASEEKLKDIFDNVPDALFTHDLQGRFSDMNPCFREMIGLDQGAPLPGDLSIRDLVPGRFWPAVDAYLEDIVRKGRCEGVMSIVGMDGKKRILEFKNTLMKDGCGRPVGVRGCARDITERTRAEKERAKLQERLQRAQKMEAIGLLAGGVAHDLNNILSGLVSYPELLLMELPEGSPLEKPLLTIKQSGEKAASIVQDLLTMARRGVRVSERLNINNVVRDYLASLDHERLAKEHPGVRLEVELAPDVVDIEGSPIHIFKTVMNLVSNAFESIEKEGVVRISTFNRTLRRPLVGHDKIGEGTYAVLVVADTGVGMTEQDKQHIFEPFYTRKVMGRSGTGLGMAVVWGAVKDHNGHLELESEPGKGTVFTLSFPECPVSREGEGSTVSHGCRHDDVEGEGSAAWEVSSEGPRPRILVVDDMEEQRELARMILQRLGYEVETASSGEEALDLVKDSPPDLVLLDMIMGDGMDGLETYRRIREVRPGQKVIIMSGFCEQDSVREALAIGATGFVRKPYLAKDIAPVLKRAISNLAA